MILEIADIRIRPGEQAAFDAAIRGGVESPDRYFAVPPQIEHFTLVAKSDPN